MKYTLSQAAKITGKSKSSISRAIDTGKISALRNGGQYEIDPAELHRVFPATSVPVDRPKNGPANDLDGGGTGSKINILEREIELLRERMADKDSQVLDLRGERDRLLKVIEEQATSFKMLEGPKQPLEAPKLSTKPLGLLGRLFGARTG